MDSLVVWPALCRSIVLEYSTSLPAELEWLGYPRFLVEQARRIEAFVLTHSTLITTPNELFMNHAQSQGGKRFCITPNYPLRSFVPKVESSIWRKKHEIRPETKVAIFIGGGHMREIYGLDLLLESWRQVEAAQPDSLLLMIGPFHGIDSGFLLDKLKLKHVKTLGTLPHDELPEWIQIGNACLAPRTPGFPSIFYNDKDSTKISEYAALGKPIVATGYSRSDQYLLTEQNADAFAEGILRCFDEQVRPATPHFWEDHESDFLQNVQDALKF
jgi:glycosyltransferase involved in cell wall biosynthesis